MPSTVNQIKTLLNEHISQNYHLLKTEYPNSKFIFLGDFNDFSPQVLLELSSQLRQVVHFATRGKSTIDLIVTDMHTLYHPPQKLGPLEPDEDENGVPSDHDGILWIPRYDNSIDVPRSFNSIQVRPIKESQKKEFGCWIGNFDWKKICISSY